MLLWRILWKAEALFLALLVGCAGIPRVSHVEEKGQGKAVVYIPRTAELQPVVLDKEKFQEALRQLAREARLSGTPRQTVEEMFQMDPQFGNYTPTETVSGARWWVGATWTCTAATSGRWP